MKNKIIIDFDKIIGKIIQSYWVLNKIPRIKQVIIDTYLDKERVIFVSEKSVYYNSAKKDYWFTVHVYFIDINLYTKMFFLNSSYLRHLLRPKFLRLVEMLNKIYLKELGITSSVKYTVNLFYLKEYLLENDKIRRMIDDHMYVKNLLCTS